MELKSLTPSDWAAWVSAGVALVGIAFPTVLWRLDRRREESRRSRELQDAAGRAEKEMLAQSHRLLIGLGTMQDDIFRAMLFLARGAKGPTTPGVLKDWQLGCDFITIVNDWSLFESTLALRLLYIESQATLFNRLMYQRALDLRSPIEHPVDLQELLTSLLAANFEVTDKLWANIRDTYAQVYKKEIPFPIRRPMPPGSMPSGEQKQDGGQTAKFVN